MLAEGVYEMKKKGIVFLLLLCFGQLWLFAIVREYYDYETDQRLSYECRYEGRYDASTFHRMAIEQKLELNQKSSDQKGAAVLEIKKISNLSNRVCWKALESYDYKPGEVYSIVIIQARILSGTMWLQHFYVRIEDDKTFSWYGIEASWLM